ncbi:beta-ketoacyl-ACP synthase III [Longimicrobium terrae]|uniref:Beta-ketoacyl-[acyl-carrier-protein] synthase III n=1 Tax=Longimicrobium terrae TaxID=1639882 RepID=A0A841GWA3_9BACT|nr:beta-ketoacyl-ACP synthase III [Longimicrobium terrae]MBB4635489.1 3-oxoacyl-[acyl-carrier-protein] synthase-3 [Longimicrobium terrae]MBB6069883.1 3-oxoacyl-[acyl-carrier-protein] synthase-3 [Longimicrobium terrae]NNC32798.1 ketoacyl-ACP synthase III [Longimicrobium terrae]
MIPSNAPRARLVSTGRFSPPRVVTNAEMETLVDTNDEWIRSRTGIRERRIADKDTGAADMAAGAARIAMERAGITAMDLDMILLSTATPDRLLPSTACDVQALLGARNAAAYDYATACSGFLYGLSMAEAHIASGQAETVLVCATEKMSSIVDWTDRTTCVLFGDGAGAAVVRKADDERGILSTYMKSDGTLADLLYRPGGGARFPLDISVLDERSHFVKMAGPEVFKSAVRAMCEAAETALQRAGVTADEIDLMVPHQANIRIIESTAKYAKMPMEKVFVNVDRYGNMSSASIPVALDEAIEQGRAGPGSLVLMVAFGAGFTWASNVVRL